MGWKDFVEWWKCLVYGPELDLALIGLQNAGKTSFARVLARGDDADEGEEHEGPKEGARGTGTHRPCSSSNEEFGDPGALFW